jgi:hypothetical protein
MSHHYRQRLALRCVRCDAPATTGTNVTPLCSKCFCWSASELELNAKAHANWNSDERERFVAWSTLAGELHRARLAAPALTAAASVVGFENTMTGDPAAERFVQAVDELIGLSTTPFAVLQAVGNVKSGTVGSWLVRRIFDAYAASGRAVDHDVIHVF